MRENPPAPGQVEEMFERVRLERAWAEHAPKYEDLLVSQGSVEIRDLMKRVFNDGYRVGRTMGMAEATTTRRGEGCTSPNS